MNRLLDCIALVVSCAGKVMLSAFILNHTSVQEASSIVRVIFLKSGDGGGIIGGSVVSQLNLYEKE